MNFDKIQKSKPKKTSSKTEVPAKMPEKQIKKSPPSGISVNAASIYEVLDRTPKSADEISDLTKLPSSAVAVGLTELELLGLIIPASGRRFVIS